MIGRLLRRFRGRGVRERLEQAEMVLGIIEKLGKGARTLPEFRERLAEGAKRGDLDDTIAWANRRDKSVEDFIQGR